MPLQAFKRSNKAGEIGRLIDVRHLGLDIKTKAYPISPELRIPVSDEKWASWLKEIGDMVQAGIFPYERNLGIMESSIISRIYSISNSLFFLKVINAEKVALLLTPKLQEAIKSYFSRLKSLYDYLRLLRIYCYLFNLPVQQECTNRVSREVLDQYIEEILSTGIGSYSCLLEFLFSAYEVYPEFFTREKLNMYWPYLWDGFLKHEYADRLLASAYFRILFPEHLTELLPYLESMIMEEGRTEYKKIAYLEILAQPEIPGLTTWPPKTNQAPQFAAKLPEQPQQLAI